MSKGLSSPWAQLFAHNMKPTQTEGKGNRTTTLRCCPAEVFSVVETVPAVSKIFTALAAFGYINTLEKLVPIPNSCASVH